MKKIFLVYIVLFSLIGTACSQSGGQSVNEDSIRIADSVARVEAEAAQKEALRQDSISQAETAKYDDMISACEKAENTYNKYAKKVEEGDYEDPTDYSELASDAYERYRVKYEALLEVIDNFTPEQFKRVQKIEKKLISPDGLLWG